MEQLGASVAEMEQFDGAELRRSRMVEAQFRLLLANWNALGCSWTAVRSAPRTQVEKLERRTNLANAAHFENELDESGCFRYRPHNCYCCRASYPVSWGKLTARKKDDFLKQKSKFKNQFFFRK